MKYLPWIICGLIALAYPFTEYLPALVPGTAWGALGIVFEPFRHANLTHLAVNLVALTFLLRVLGRDPPGFALPGLLAVILVGGAFVYFFGREGVHEGASGLALGVLGMLALRYGFETAVCISALVATGVALEMNKQLNVSWETHAGGFLAGLNYAYIAMRWYTFKEYHYDSQSCSSPATCPAQRRGAARSDRPGARRGDESGRQEPPQS